MLAALFLSALASTATPPLALPPPPPGFEARHPLEPEDYVRKNERGYVTGLPLFNYDPNTGYGFGARAYYFWNGTRADPLFAYSPYLHRVFLQVFLTTRGLQFHWLDYDVPSLFGTPFRFRSQFIYMSNNDEHYFGLGNRATGLLGFSGSTKTYDSFATYAADLARVTAAGTSYSRYDSYELKRPLALVSIERSYLHGFLRPLFGFGFNHYSINDYTGRPVNATDPAGNATTAPSAPTRLREDCDRNAIVGCSGGWDNFLRFGLSFDTRDFEPDPNHGVFIDAAFDIGTGLLGSRYDWTRLLVAPRIYVDLLPEKADLVFAARATLQWQSKKTPFFGMKLIPYTEDPRDGLGGLRTMRGFSQDRFVGPMMTAYNFELRWTFVRGTLWKQKLGLIAVPFVDLGAAYDGPSDVRLTGLRRDQGAALRVSWNLATIITFEYGVSDEDSGFYINFNHIF